MIDGDRLPTLDAPRVRLRWLTAEDADGLYAIFSDRTTMRYWSTPAMTERRQGEDYLRSIHEGFAAKTLFQWGVERRDGGELLGTVTLFNIHVANRCAEVGYVLRSAHWGRGYMSEALGALIDHSFAVLKLRRLEADVDPNNAKSLRILERMGFSREGLLRERWNVAGEIQDSVFLGLLAREWQERRQ